MRAWLDANLPDDLRPKSRRLRRLSRRPERCTDPRQAAGVAPACRGMGRTRLTWRSATSFEEECGYVATPPLIPSPTCARRLLRFGPRRRKTFLPRIYDRHDFVPGLFRPGSVRTCLLKTKAGHETTTGKRQRRGPRSRTTPTDLRLCSPNRTGEARRHIVPPHRHEDARNFGAPLILMDGTRVNEFLRRPEVPSRTVHERQG